MIRFLYEQELVELSDTEADLTVLDWLRLHRNKTGTKEGCGSGDCGACTVVTASVIEDADKKPALSYETINSCIAFVGALHGKQLLSVESLDSGGELHPVQQAMVEEHGSQCGFCTPGFVMSLYALYQKDEPEDVLKLRVDQALAGNLCRCTGYRPIKSAASVALDYRKESDTRAVANPELIERLQAIIESTAGQTNGFVQPDSLEELARYYQQHPDCRLLAGGTDLALEVTQQMKSLPHVLHVAHVPQMRVREVHVGHVLLGAAVTLSECLDLLSNVMPAVRDMLLRFGSDQVRNQATLGGNLGSASPIGDLPPLLLALDATLTLQSGNTCRVVPVQDYFVGYRQTCLQAGEFILQVTIPIPQPDAVFAVYKVSKRTDDDISSVCAAIYLPQSQGLTHDARLAFGGMAAIPIRVADAENSLNGHVFDERAVANAQVELGKILQPISDARASAAYRLLVAQNLLRRAYLEFAEQGRYVANDDADSGDATHGR